MIGTFVYCGDNARAVAAAHSRHFQPFDWIERSSVANQDAVISVFHHTGGVNAEGAVLEADGRVAFLQGYLFAEGRPHTTAAEALKATNGGADLRVDTGAFNFGILDERERVMRLTTDRFGMLPLYRYRAAGELFLSSRLDAIAGLAKEPPTPDAEGVADVLTVGYCLGHDTVYEGVKLLPHACTLEYHLDTGHVSTEQYWQPAFDYSATAGIAEQADAVHAALRTAMAQLSQLAPSHHAVKLSGGLDSRTIYALHERPDLALTFGFPGGRERRFAREVIEAGGQSVDHHELAFSAQVAQERFDTLARLAEPVWSHDVPYLPEVSEHLRKRGAALHFDGYLGDVLFGGTYYCKPSRRPGELFSDVARGYRETPLDEDAVARVKASMAQSLEWAMGDELREALGDAAIAHVRRRVGEVVDLARAQFPDLRYAEDLMDLTQILFARGRRYIRQGPLVDQYYLDIVMPFFHYAVFDAYLRTPPRHRSWHRIYKALYRRHLGPYGEVGCTSTDGLAPNAPHRAAILKTYAGEALRKLGVSRAPEALDLARWLREDGSLRRFMAERAGPVRTWPAIARLATLGIPMEEARAVVKAAGAP